MQFEDKNIQDLVCQFKLFSVEGFNVFGIGKDELPHLVCVCPNKNFARAIQSLLIIAKQTHPLQAGNIQK